LYTTAKCADVIKNKGEVDLDEFETIVCKMKEFDQLIIKVKNKLVNRLGKIYVSPHTTQ